MLVSSAEKDQAVDHELVRRNFKEARLQAGLAKGGSTIPYGAPNAGGWYGSGLQPLALTPSFNAVGLGGGSPPLAQSAFLPPVQQYIPQAPAHFGGPGHYGPQHGGGRGSGGGRRGGRGGGRGQGRGGGTPVCNKYSQSGQPANHSHRVCPLSQCFKCGAMGHIRRNCPN